MRNVNQATIDLIKRFEGCVLHVYKDVAGFPSIGIGHLITEGEVFDTITMGEAEELLQKDLTDAIRGVIRLIKTPLTDDQFGAIVSFTFNLGSGCLQRSTLRSRINRGDFDVYSEFLKYNKAGRPLRVWKGLTLRRQAEAILFGGSNDNS
jgi:lysozyme